MDFSYFNAAAAQPYQFIGLPPIPTYSSAGHDGKLGTTDLLDPTFLPPYDAFANFAQGIIPATTTSATAGSPPAPHSPILMPVIGSVDSGLGIEGMESMDGFGGRSRRSSTEEKEAPTPAQTRRKAQNRAAQRAFRDRKERHVKDLEAKLSALESSASSLQSDNERLKLALQRATTENEILRATSQRRGGGGSTNLVGRSGSMPDSPSTDGDNNSAAEGAPRPQEDGADVEGDEAAEEADRDAHAHAYATNPLFPHTTPSSSSSYAAPSTHQHPHRTTHPLSAGAAWDLIQSHPLVKQGLIDIADVSDRLRHLARCSGGGLVFAERDVWRAVEEGRRGGGDELI